MRTYSKNVQAKARIIEALASDPKYAALTWNWTTIATVLSVSPAMARQVIYCLRDSSELMTWTVPVWASGWTSMPTDSVTTALPGTINQLRHDYTRLESLLHLFRVLTVVDPDPKMRVVAFRQIERVKEALGPIQAMLSELETI